ncbi:MAG TPA: hypothetical protein V6D12_16595 [Candidatus Obscuribacterales bacterium]
MSTIFYFPVSITSDRILLIAKKQNPYRRVQYICFLYLDDGLYPERVSLKSETLTSQHPPPANDDTSDEQPSTQFQTFLTKASSSGEQPDFFSNSAT